MKWDDILSLVLLVAMWIMGGVALLVRYAEKPKMDVLTEKQMPLVFTLRLRLTASEYQRFMALADELGIMAPVAQDGSLDPGLVKLIFGGLAMQSALKTVREEFDK